MSDEQLMRRYMAIRPANVGLVVRPTGEIVLCGLGPALREQSTSEWRRRAHWLRWHANWVYVFGDGCTVQRYVADAAFRKFHRHHRAQYAADKGAADEWQLWRWRVLRDHDEEALARWLQDDYVRVYRARASSFRRCNT